MTIGQVRDVYIRTESIPCPVTDRLVKNGYQQTGGGYIDYAKAQGVEVDYQKALPSQYWHLIYEYCANTDHNRTFGRSVVCGELIFWMAEVLGCVSSYELNIMADTIIAARSSTGTYDRRKWNKEIQDLCFDKIKAKVEHLTMQEEKINEH